jgi:chromosome segregation ATPase
LEETLSNFVKDWKRNNNISRLSKIYVQVLKSELHDFPNQQWLMSLKPKDIIHIMRKVRNRKFNDEASNKKKQEMESLLREVTNLNNQVISLKKHPPLNLEEDCSENERKEEEMRDLVDVLELEKSEVESKLMLLEKKTHQLEEERNRLEDQLKEERNRLQNRMEEQQNRLLEEERNRLEEELNRLKDEQNRLEEENNRLEEEKTQWEEDRKRLEEERNRLQESNSNLLQKNKQISSKLQQEAASLAERKRKLVQEEQLLEGQKKSLNQ